jgi:dihydrofolate reductase
MIKIIVAISKNNIIGSNNTLPWKLSSDLKRFKELTTNNPIIMGRKTFESIGKVLPNRRNIVVTRNIDFNVENCETVSSIEEALMLTNNDCFIIGGEIYKQTINIADKIYLTLVDTELNGDTSFPEIDSTWFKVKEEKFNLDDKNEYNYPFIKYEKYEF